MNPLILVAMVACASMNIYAAHIIIRRTTRGFACVCINMTGSVYGCIVPTWNRHAFVCGEVSAKVTEVQTERIQCNTVRDDAARMSASPAADQRSEDGDEDRGSTHEQHAQGPPGGR